MTEYYFGQKKKAHKFCKTCGTSILIDFKRNEHGVTDPEKDKLAVNVKHFFSFFLFFPTKTLILPILSFPFYCPDSLSYGSLHS